jgi:lipoprotein-anchoring transpeptidase ErfK/SrfK
MSDDRLVSRRSLLRLGMAGVAVGAAGALAGCAVPSDLDLQAATLGYRPVEQLGTPENEPYPVPRVDMNRIPKAYHRQLVESFGYHDPGTIVVDVKAKHLYYQLDRTSAIRYGVGVGREGFAWGGKATIGRKAEWPRWTPPPEMIARDPSLAKYADGMDGGPANPLGARALYLYQGRNDTLFRIHGTNEPLSIGQAMSSGCIRMLNKDVIDLYERAKVGTPVVVYQNGDQSA